jgi:hypothetical protein
LFKEIIKLQGYLKTDGPGAYRGCGEGLLIADSQKVPLYLIYLVDSDFTGDGDLNVVKKLEDHGFNPNNVSHLFFGAISGWEFCVNNIII